MYISQNRWDRWLVHSLPIGDYLLWNPSFQAPNSTHRGDASLVNLLIFR